MAIHFTHVSKRSFLNFADDFESGSDLDDQHGDGETEDYFMQTYSDALNKELNETTLNKSFVRAQEHTDNNVQVLFVSDFEGLRFLISFFPLLRESPCNLQELKGLRF